MTTQVITVTSCGPEVNNCPGSSAPATPTNYYLTTKVTSGTTLTQTVPLSPPATPVVTPSGTPSGTPDKPISAESVVVPSTPAFSGSVIVPPPVAPSAGIPARPGNGTVSYSIPSPPWATAGVEGSTPDVTAATYSPPAATSPAASATPSQWTGAAGRVEIAGGLMFAAAAIALL